MFALSEYLIVLLQLPWAALPQYPPVTMSPKIHEWLISWFTSGFV